MIKEKSGMVQNGNIHYNSLVLTTYNGTNLPNTGNYSFALNVTFSYTIWYMLIIKFSFLYVFLL